MTKLHSLGKLDFGFKKKSTCSWTCSHCKTKNSLTAPSSAGTINIDSMKDMLSFRPWQTLFEDISGKMLDEYLYPIMDMDHMTEEMNIAVHKNTGAPTAENALIRAQKCLWDSDWKNAAKRIKSAEESLKISPDCADAYLMLANEETKSQSRKIELCRLAVSAARRALGEETINDPQTRFYLDMNTRPYLRAMFGLAYALQKDGQTAEAIKLWQEMMKIEPEDHHCTRWYLSMALVSAHRWDEAERLLDRYADEQVPYLLYSRALCSFRKYGKCDASLIALETAILENFCIIDCLSYHQKGFTRKARSYSALNRVQAFVYMTFARESWLENDDETYDWATSVIEQIVFNNLPEKDFPTSLLEGLEIFGTPAEALPSSASNQSLIGGRYEQRLLDGASKRLRANGS